MKALKTRNRSIEFWRFVFSMEVVYYHTSNSTALPASHFVHGGWCVEFFFILSGFLMAYTWKNVEYNQILINAWNKTIKRIKSLAPMVYFCLVLIFFYRFYIYRYNMGWSNERLLDYGKSAILELFFLNGFHDISNHANGPSWYISTLIICGFFIYILLGIFSQVKLKYKFLVYLLVAIWGYSNYFQYPTSVIVSIYRGIGGLALGLFVYELYQIVHKYNSNKVCRILVSLLELLGIIYALMVLTFDYEGRYCRGLIGAFAVIVFCSFLGQSKSTQLLNNKFSEVLGNISLGIYLGHMLLLVHFGLDVRFDLLANPKLSYMILTGAVLLYAFFLTIIFDKKFRTTCWSIIEKNKVFSTFFITLVLLFVCIYQSTRFFDQSVVFTKKYYLYLLVLMLVLGIVVSIGIKILWGLKECDVKTVFFVKSFTVILIVYVAFLLLTWPGIWRWDEFWILNNAKYLQFNAYQNFLTSIFYILSLMIIPFPTGVIIVEIFLCSAIAAYVCTVVNLDGNISKKYYWMIYVPFFLQPAVCSVLYPIRNSIFGFFEIGIYSFVYFKMIKPQRAKVKDLLVFVVVIAILTAWRGETFYYMIMIPLIVLVCLWKTEYRKRIICAMFACAILGSIFIRVQSDLEKNTIGNDYKIISMLSFIYQETQLGGIQGDVADDIEKVISLEVLEKEGIDAIWTEDSGLIRKGYSQEDFRCLETGYIRLIITNPVGFVKQQIEYARNANGLGGRFTSPFIEKSYDLYSEQNLSSTQGETMTTIFLTEEFTWPLSADFRSIIVKILQCVRIETEENNLLFPLLYNSVPAIFLLIIVLFRETKRKEIYWCGIVLIVLLKTLIVILAAPGGPFMYYFPTWLCGYTIWIMRWRRIRKCEETI
ncbi:MAG: acyltransferase [Lachnospiraceae bacterium]|nr:acyltransferase [Lachnospiraceae bacterium]